jgi:hypothetical protein
MAILLSLVLALSRHSSIRAQVTLPNLCTANHPQLAAEQKRLGIDAFYSPKLALTIDPQALELMVDIPKPKDLAFEIHGSIILLDSTGPPK